jgi:ribonuclease/clavin/mitogillin
MSELPGGVAPAEVPAPRDSALSVLLRRNRSGEWQVLLGLRSRKARFLPGNLAFPGGGMEPEDRPDENGSWSRCVSRELSEETGIQIPPERWLDGGERSTPPMFPVRYRTRFLVAELPSGDDAAPPPVTSENEELLWSLPGTAVRGFEAGRLMLPPPVLALLRALAAAPPDGLHEVAALTNRVNAVEEESPRIEFVPGIWCLPVGTDTLPPATHTNVWMPHGKKFVVIDPGSDREAENRRLLKVITRLRRETAAEPLAVLLTHHHQDHVSGASEIAQELGVPVRAHSQVLQKVGHVLEGVETVALTEGEPILLEGLSLVPALTPGHADGHLVFHVPERNVLISADLVSALSTMIVEPRPGAMDTYIASLRKASRIGAARLLPSHGPPVPAAVLEKTVRHREAREEKILDTLPEASALYGAVLSEISKSAYDDTPGAPPFLAAGQTRSHLHRLEEQGRATLIAGKDERWRKGS